MGDEEVGEIRFLTIDSNLTTMTAPIVFSVPYHLCTSHRVCGDAAHRLFWVYPLHFPLLRRQFLCHTQELYSCRSVFASNRRVTTSTLGALKQWCGCVSSVWVCMLLYIWSLLALVLMPDQQVWHGLLSWHMLMSDVAFRICEHLLSTTLLRCIPWTTDYVIWNAWMWGVLI